MSRKPTSKRTRPKPRAVLRLPDLDQAKSAVLNSLTSADAQPGYRHAIDEFVDWYCSEPRLSFNRTVVLRYRIHLEDRRLAPGTVNLRLGAVRRLAYEVADCGLLSPDLAAGIRRVKGVKKIGVIGVGDSKSGHLRDLSAFEYTVLRNISNDGSMILVNSFDIAGDTNYRLYAQGTNGSPPVLVGHGAGGNFSPDGKWVTAVDPGHPENLSVIPTGLERPVLCILPRGLITSAFPCCQMTSTFSLPRQVLNRLRRAR